MRINVLDDGKIGAQPIDADDEFEVFDARLLEKAWRWEGTTTNATPTALTADNNVGLEANTVYAFEGLVVARYSGASTGAAYRVQGCVKKGAANANTALVGTPLVTAYEDTAGMDLGITADTTNGCLILTGTGVTSTTINWRAKIKFVKVGASL